MLCFLRSGRSVVVPFPALIVNSKWASLPSPGWDGFTHIGLPHMTYMFYLWNINPPGYPASHAYPERLTWSATFGPCKIQTLSLIRLEWYIMLFHWTFIYNTEVLSNTSSTPLKICILSSSGYFVYLQYGTESVTYSKNNHAWRTLHYAFHKWHFKSSWQVFIALNLRMNTNETLKAFT